MIDMWNARYAEPEFAYGKNPNQYFKQQLAKLKSPPGKILMPAEGEGRNAVYAATLGWEVSAFDISEEGRKKAMRLAKEENVSIDYHVGPYEDELYLEESFDALGLIFAHFPPHLRQTYHKGFLKLLKPGGTVIFEAFAKSHVAHSAENPKAGGPKNLDMLFSVDEVRNEFQGVDFFEVGEQIIWLEEGVFHVGDSSVIRFVGEKV